MTSVSLTRTSRDPERSIETTEGSEVVNVLIAPDKFKGSLSAGQVIEAVERGVRKALDAHAPESPRALVVEGRPLADGGEGTAPSFLAAGYECRYAEVLGPLGRPANAPYYLKGDSAFIEFADGAGLALCGPDRRALDATSYGAGQLIRNAMEAGARHVFLGVGGSASTDGGAGILEALGARLTDSGGAPIPRGGGGLLKLAHVDLDDVFSLVTDVSFTVLADVNCTLFGADGAARMFSPQKGATGADVVALEDGLQQFVSVLAGRYGERFVEAASMPGAGSGGGAGYGMIAALDADYRSGIETVMSLLGIDELVREADFVITGEGGLDEQTLRGKVVSGVTQVARKYGKPCLVVAGQSKLTRESLARLGVTGAVALTDIESDVDRCIAEAANLLEAAAKTLAERHIIG